MLSGVSRWNELAEGKSSDQLVDILLNELAGSGADKDVPDFFEPLVNQSFIYDSNDVLIP